MSIGGRDRQLNKNPMGYIHGTVRSAQVISVIRTESRTGAGTEENPNRIVTQYWSTDGELLLETFRDVGPKGPQSVPYRRTDN